MPNPGDVVLVDFPGAQGIKRRPGVILSSPLYHTTRPDLIVGLITTHTMGATAPSDYVLQDWAAAGLHRPSAFRTFLSMIPNFAVRAQVGHLSTADWQGVCASVKSALAAL